MENQLKTKRLASKTVFHKRTQKGSVFIDKAILFKDYNSSNKYIAVVYNNSTYEVVNLISNEILSQGDFLKVISSSTGHTKTIEDFQNTIYKVDHVEAFTFLIIDDKSIHLVDLITKTILGSVSFPQPNNTNKQMSEYSSFQFQQTNYIKWRNTRKAFESSCVISMSSSDGRILIILDRFESQTYPELLIFHRRDNNNDTSNELVLFRQKLQIKSEQSENGKLLCCFFPELNTIFLGRECFLQEEFMIYQISLNEELKTTHKLQRIVGENQMFEKITLQIIDLREIDKETLGIFVNGNNTGLPGNNLTISHNTGPQILRYNTSSGQFVSSISLSLAEIKESGIISSVLSISEQFILLQFMATTGSFIVILNKTNNILQKLYGFNTFQKNCLNQTITDTFKNDHDTHRQNHINTSQKYPIDFNIMPLYDVQSVIQDNMTQLNNDSELCFFAINSKRNKVKQYYPVGISESIIYFLRQKGIEGQVSEIALHDVVEMLGLLSVSLRSN